MAQNHITVVVKMRFCTTTDSQHGYEIAPNLLDRKFEVEAPNKVWAADFTYMRTSGGWLFLAVVLDLYSRRVVGWSMREDMSTPLVLNALRMAVGNDRSVISFFITTIVGVNMLAMSIERHSIKTA